MPEELVKRADRQAKKEQSNRSELLRTALRSYLVQRERWDTIFTYGEKQAKKLNIKEKDVVRLVREVRRGA